MRNFFSVPMAMLIAVLTLMIFFEHTDAGTPAVYPDAEATANSADALVSCGIEGRLKNKEYYSGSAYVYARCGTEKDSDSDIIWAEVYKTGWWWWSELYVDTSPTVSITVFGDNATSAYAYARGNLGSVVERTWDRYSDE